MSRRAEPVGLPVRAFLSEESRSSPWMSGDQRSVVMLRDRQLWRHADWCDGAPLLAGCREEYHDLQGLIRRGGLAVRSCQSAYLYSSRSTVEIGRNARRLPTKGLCMSKSQQYRAKATEYGELVKTSTSPEESDKSRCDLRQAQASSRIQSV